MKVEHAIKTIIIDENWNDSVRKLAEDGYVMLPGVKPIGIFPVVRTVPEEGEAQPPRPANPLANMGPNVNMGVGDEEVYILRGGKLIDAQGNVVTEEERQRRWAAAEERRQKYADKKQAVAEAAEGAVQ